MGASHKKEMVARPRPRQAGRAGGRQERSPRALPVLRPGVRHARPRRGAHALRSPGRRGCAAGRGSDGGLRQLSQARPLQKARDGPHQPAAELTQVIEAEIIQSGDLGLEVFSLCRARLPSPARGGSARRCPENALKPSHFVEGPGQHRVACRPIRVQAEHEIVLPSEAVGAQDG
jgi:hypothetical protein